MTMDQRFPGKVTHCAEEQDNESTDSFQNYDSRRLSMFLYQGWYLHEEKKNLIFNIIYGKFWPATSSVEILTPA